MDALISQIYKKGSLDVKLKEARFYPILFTFKEQLNMLFTQLQKL